MLTRRGFLGLLVGGVTAARLPWTPVAPQADVGLLATDPQVGIAIRFIKQWDMARDSRISRYDVYALRPDLVYGLPAWPPVACRIEG